MKTATDYVKQHVFHAAQMCVGIGMGEGLHYFHSEGGENFNVGVPEKCISGHFERPGQEILAFRMTFLFTTICITIASLFLWNKVLGSK